MEMRGMSGELLGTIGSTNYSSSDSRLRTSDAQTSIPTASRKSTITAPLPSAFLSKKRKILDSLHPPDQAYTDKSPKGSVDAEIADLIDEVNAYPGLVTTSSCAGRVSVFLEGAKPARRANGEGEDDADESQPRGEATRSSTAKSVPGGKGLGGRWLFVSHEPLGDSLSRPRARARAQHETWSGLFHLAALHVDGDVPTVASTLVPRLVKFAFEPLILHVLCADLRHAAPLLAAAVNAGFRESGVQSLKVLDAGERGGGEGVMVGIRSAGLGLESLIGVLDGDGKGEDELCRAIVGEEYLDLLVRTSGERFKANEERRERFRKELREHMGRFEEGKSGLDGWEDKDVRARRKRMEGLQRKEELRQREIPEQQSTSSVAGDEIGEDLYET